MTCKENTNAEDDEIILIDILIFLKASAINTSISILVCLGVGAAYYFSTPKLYEATATITMATVAGEPVEVPTLLLEKMKLPLYFAPATLKACGSDGELSSQAKFFDKIKPTVNKSVPLVSFAVQAQSAQEAKECLVAVISEVSKNLDEIAKPQLEHKKQKLTQLSGQLKLAEDIAKIPLTTKANNNVSDTQFSTRTAMIAAAFLANATEMNDLRKQINILESSLIAPQTMPSTLAAPLYAPEVTSNKRPLFTLGLSLVYGVFLGLLVTGMKRLVPEIRRQIREFEDRSH